jgi:hypothetical protein
LYSQLATVCIASVTGLAITEGGYWVGNKIRKMIVDDFFSKSDKAIRRRKERKRQNAG